MNLKVVHLESVHNSLLLNSKALKPNQKFLFGFFSYCFSVLGLFIVVLQLHLWQNNFRPTNTDTTRIDGISTRSTPISIDGISIAGPIEGWWILMPEVQNRSCLR